MDLGIRGRSAIVCGASRGLGFACASALANEGANLVLIARDQGRLDEAAKELRALDVDVQAVAGDVSDPGVRERALAACPEPDVLVTNAGGPPPGDFRDWEREDWLRALDLNMLAPIAFIRATIDGMMARRFGRIVNIASSSVKAPIDVLGLSNGARAGLVGFVAGLARQSAVANVTINNILPGSFDTDRTLENLSYRARSAGTTVEEERRRRNAGIPARRAGDPAELGALCAYLCSAQAGYITGQSVLIDGGRYPGVF